MGCSKDVKRSSASSFAMVGGGVFEQKEKAVRSPTNSCDRGAAGLRGRCAQAARRFFQGPWQCAGISLTGAPLAHVAVTQL